VDSFAYSREAQSLAYIVDSGVPDSSQLEVCKEENESNMKRQDESTKHTLDDSAILGNRKAGILPKFTRHLEFGRKLAYLGIWMVALSFTIRIISYAMGCILAENESVEEYKNPGKNTIQLRTAPAETEYAMHLICLPPHMPSCSAPASPAPLHYMPRPFLRGSDHCQIEPDMPLISPLSSLPAGVLDRTRKGTFGREDPYPREGTVLSRVQAASNAQWIEHGQGNELTIRPGSVVSPQTLFTGRERRATGQETYHAILLNARLLIHNPETGEPGAINGHASVQLHAAPNSDRVWNLEVPYVSDHQIQNTSASVLCDLTPGIGVCSVGILRISVRIATLTVPHVYLQ
jgi:hypothetical protein